MTYVISALNYFVALVGCLGLLMAIVYLVTHGDGSWWDEDEK